MVGFSFLEIGMWKGFVAVDGRRRGRGSWPLVGLIFVSCFSPQLTAQVISYEGTVFPEELGWERLFAASPGRRLEDGWLIQTFSQPGQDFYRYDLGGAVFDSFFLEWRAITDNPEWLIEKWQVPAVAVAGGKGGVLYHTVMTESAAALYRDFTIPLVIVPISLGAPHTYRIDVYPDEYVWYIDGAVADTGVPEGPYPDPNARVGWGAELTYDGAPPAVTAWDFARFGKIPEQGSADYDTDGATTLYDYFFFHDCLTKDGELYGGPWQAREVC